GPAASAGPPCPPARPPRRGGAGRARLRTDGHRDGRGPPQGSERGNGRNLDKLPRGGESPLLPVLCPGASRLVPYRPRAGRVPCGFAPGTTASVLAVPGDGGRHLSHLHAAGRAGDAARHLLGARPGGLRGRRLSPPASV